MESKLLQRDIANCCRTCLNDFSSKMFDLFTDVNDSVNVAQMLEICISLEVSPVDNLPKKLCIICYNCIISFYAFKRQAQKNDQTLRDHFKIYQIENKNGIDDNTVTNVKTEKADSDYDIYDDDDVKQEPIQTKELFYCTKCPSTFERVTDFRKHFKFSKNKSYTSITCEQYRAKRNLKHNTIQESNLSELVKVEEDTIYECDNCSAKFTSVNSLSAHKRKHASKDRVLSCKKCGKIFKKISHLKRHELIHDTIKPYKCTSCTKSFKTSELLEEHLNRHRDGAPYKCPLCLKLFWHSATLSNHMKKHSRVNEHLCSVCGKRFSSTGNLKQHQLRHKGDRRFDCSMCPRKFISKGELKKHTVTHTGERLFSCDKCNAKFTAHSSLRKHNLRHLGVKPFKCDTCPMKFTTKGHLGRHYRTHTGERPYRCEICDRTFTQSNDLEKHKRSHLGNEVYECHECSQRFRLKTELRNHVSEHYIASKLEEMRVNAECPATDSNMVVI